MSDEKDQDQSPEEELDPQKLADEVANGMLDAEESESASDEGEGAADGDDQDLADEWAAAMESKPLSADDHPELDVILDIPVRISMEVGATKIPIRNLLQLNQGSVVELDRLAGEPLDVLVNGTLIAHGEVVMVNDKFGIRLTDVVSQSERIQRLR
jgi:flagellar motor switch protein FliN/FliY